MGPQQGLFLGQFVLNLGVLPCSFPLNYCAKVFKERAGKKRFWPGGSAGGGGCCLSAGKRGKGGKRVFFFFWGPDPWLFLGVKKKVFVGGKRGEKAGQRKGFFGL